MGSTSLLGFSCPNPLLVFRNLLFLGTCYLFFRKCWDFLWVYFILFFCALFWVSLLMETRFFALKSKKEEVLDRGQNGFQCEDNNDNNNNNNNKTTNISIHRVVANLRDLLIVNECCAGIFSS